MVQIVIKISEAPVEWGLIELQGYLETKEEELAGLHIGNLHFDENGTAHLIVGHHALTGKASALPKPYAVLKKITTQNEDIMDVDNDGNGKETSYEVKAFVKQKIIFKNRPRPIIVQPAPITR